MHDPLFVGGFERVRDLQGDRQRLAKRNRPARNAIGESRAVDQLQYERMDTIGFLEPINRGDVRMIQRGEELRLALEPRQKIRIEREGCRQDFQRDISIESGVTSSIHLTHAAAPMADWISYTP